MGELAISDMMQMQRELWALHRDSWSPMEPKYGRDFILWMLEEIGESIAIIKKKGDQAIAQTPNVRAAFLEEMCDVLMYYFDTLLRYGVTPEELSAAYSRKHAKNMNRNFQKEYQEKLFTQEEV